MIAVVGTAAWDVTVTADRLPALGEHVKARVVAENPGGAACNTAARIASHGHPVGLVVSDGDGPNGARFRAACQARHLRPLKLELLPAHGDLATCTVIVTPGGERSMIWARPPRPAPRGPSILTDDADRLLRAARLAWIQASDSGLREECWRLVHHGSRCLPVWHLEDELAAGRRWDVLVGSLADAPLPEPRQLDALRCTLAVMTDGAAGAHVWTGSDGWLTVPAAPAHPVADTVGAGDAFLAGLLVALHDGQRPLQAASRAARWAAQAVAQTGGWPAGPEPDPA